VSCAVVEGCPPISGGWGGIVLALVACPNGKGQIMHACFGLGRRYGGLNPPFRNVSDNCIILKHIITNRMPVYYAVPLPLERLWSLLSFSLITVHILKHTTCT